MPKPAHYLSTNSDRTACGRLQGKMKVTSDREVVECAACKKALDDGKRQPAPVEQVFNIDDLTDQMVRFASHPEVLTNAYKAAVDAGYSPATAKVKAHLMKEKMLPVIRQFSRMRMDRLEVSVDAIQQELSAMAHVTLHDFYHYHEDGTITLKQPPEWTRAMASAVKSFDVTPYEVETENGPELRDRIVNVKLYDRRAAAETLGKSLGAFSEKLLLVRAQTDADREQEAFLEQLPDDDLKQVRRMLERVQEQQEKRKPPIEGEFKRISKQ